MNTTKARGLTQTPFLPGFEAYGFSNWQVPRLPDVREGIESREDEKLEKILSNPRLALSEKQKEAVTCFVATVANETAATMGGIPEFERLARIRCHDYRDQKGGRCEVALQQGSDAHLIRYGWIVEIKNEQAEEQATVQFGITCLKKILGLSRAEITLIRGLNSWVKDSSLRWLKKQFLMVIREGKTVKEYHREWRGSFDFDEFQTAMQRILSDPNRFALAYTNELTRVRFAGRTISACKAAGFLLNAGLPVPYEIVKRVLRGARKLYR